MGAGEESLRVQDRGKLGNYRLQLLILQLSFQFLGFRHLSDGFVEVILVDGVTVIFDGKQTAICGRLAVVHFRKRGNKQHLRFGNDVSQIRPVESIAHLHDTLEVDLPIKRDA